LVPILGNGLIRFLTEAKEHHALAGTKEDGFAMDCLLDLWFEHDTPDILNKIVSDDDAETFFDQVRVIVVEHVKDW